MKRLRRDLVGRRCRVFCCALAALWASAGATMGAPRYARLPLRELPQIGTLSREVVTLEQLAASYRRADQHGADHLLIYLWDASADWRPPVQSAYLAELEALDTQCWDERLRTRTTPISVVTVYGSTEAERERVYRAIQAALLRRIRIPTFVDTSLQMPQAVAEATGDTRAFIPALFRVDATALDITGKRGDDPIAADGWVRLLLAPAALPGDDPSDIPRGAEWSWYRRHIARVVRAGVMDLEGDSFRPKATVTDAEFIEWLARASSERARVGLRDVDPDRPVVLSRERAITATVRVIYGDDPMAFLADCAPPTRDITEGRQADAASLWMEGLNQLPGSSNVSPALRPYVALALATGLLPREPSLHARWPLTREVAAWLLAHALESPPQGRRANRSDAFSGLVINAVDVPLEVDDRFGVGEIYYEQAGRLRQVYPAGEASSRLPVVPSGYPWVVYATQDALADEGSREAQLLSQRVGARPLVLTALRVRGPGALARGVVISASDGARLAGLNRTHGVLDDWRVAMITGVGAQLASPADGHLPRRGTISVRFSVPMDPETIDARSVRLQRRDTREPVPAELSWQTRTPSEVSIEPKAPLAPGVEYDVVLTEGLRSARGEPLRAPPSAELPAGMARRWTITAAAGETDRGAAPRPEAPQRPPQVPPAQERPARLIAEGVPREVESGQRVTVILRAVDGAGSRVRNHVPIRVTLEATGCELSPGRLLTVEGGEGSFTFRAPRPGRVLITLVATDPWVRADQVIADLRCR